MKTQRILVFTLVVFCHISGSRLYGLDTPAQSADQPVGQARVAPGQQQEPSRYTIREGDCLGKILRDAFSLTDEIIFSPRTQLLLQEANPHLRNLKDLRAGEHLLVPVYLFQHPLQGKAGPVKTTAPKQQKPDIYAAPDTAAAPTVEATATVIKNDTALRHTPAHTYVAESEEMLIQEKSIASADTLDREKKVRMLLASLAAACGGGVTASSEKRIEIENAGAVTLDCSRFPLYEFPWGKQIILDYGERMPPSLQKIIAATWKRTELISVSESATPKSVLDKVIEVCGLQKLESENRYTINQDDTRIMVTGDWIVFKDTEHKNIFIISIDDGPSLPASLNKYLARQGINFIVLADPVAADCPSAEYSSAPSLDNLADPAAFTDALLDLAGISYQRNVKTKLIPRNETGITLEMSSDRKFLIHGKPCFIVFKNISENLSNLFQNQGYKVLQIDRNQHLSYETVQSLLNFLGFKITTPTCSLQYDHSSTTAIKITFPGFLLQTKNGDLLLTNTKIDSDILNYVQNLHIKTLYF